MRCTLFYWYGFIYLLQYGCVTAQKPENQSTMKNIEHFLQKIQYFSRDDTNVVLNHYFINSRKIQANAELYQMYEKAFIDLKSVIQQDSYSIHSYSEVKDKLPNIHPLVSSNLAEEKDIFVLQFEKQTNYVYIKTKGDRMVSILPMKQGSRIIGWL